MPILASIPESSTAPLYPRSNSRSRVLVIPRRPSRRRKPVFKSAAFVGLFPAETHGRRVSVPGLGRPESTETVKRSANDDDKVLTFDAVALEDVSELSSPVEQTFEPSIASIDLDSFPVPPFNENTAGDFSFATKPAFTTSNVTNTRANIATRHSARITSHPPRRNARTSKKATEAVGRTIDGASDYVHHSRCSSVDSALVDAITRNVAQQWHLFSFSDGSEMPGPTKEAPKEEPELYQPSEEAESRTSSQRRALKRFTRELQKYAKVTDATGKLPDFTPTATPAATMRTVSDLLPFHNEFRIAGLAVTSAEQARRRPHHHHHRSAPVRVRQSSAEATRVHHKSFTQFDGGVESRVSQNAYSELSLTPSRNLDEWRYALIDEVPPSKPARPAPSPTAKSPIIRCIPCLGNEDPTTDGEGSQSNKDAGNPTAHMWEPATSAPPSVPPPLTRDVPRPSGRTPPRMVAGERGSGQRRPHRRPAEQAWQRAAQYRPFGSLANNHSRMTGFRRSSIPVPLGMPFNTPQAAMNIRTGMTRRRDQPRTRAELAQLGEVSPYYTPKAQTPKQPMPPRQQSLQALTLDGQLAKRTPARARKGLASSSLPGMPCAWTSTTTSTLEEAMVRAAANVARKENVLLDKRGSTVARTSKHDIRSSRLNEGPPSAIKANKRLSSRPTSRPNIPKRTSSIRDGLRSSELERETREITDRDVLRGLHVAMAAACDEEVDLLIRNKTGLQIRRFLADLMAFEELGDKRDGEDNEQRARRRRSEMRKLKQQVRRSREVGKAK